MYACMYACMYVCTYLCMHVYIHTYIRATPRHSAPHHGAQTASKKTARQRTDSVVVAPVSCAALLGPFALQWRQARIVVPRAGFPLGMLPARLRCVTHSPPRLRSPHYSRCGQPCLALGSGCQSLERCRLVDRSHYCCSRLQQGDAGMQTQG